MQPSDWYPHFFPLLELEQAESRARFEARRAELSLEVRAARGFCIPDLVCVEDAVGLAGRVLLTFERSPKAELETRIGVGAPVELRPRKAVDDTSLRAIVSRRNRQQVTIALDSTPPTWLTESMVVLELCPDDVTFERARQALRQTQAREGTDRTGLFRVLRAEDPPRFESPSGSITQALAQTSLNPEQREATEGGLLAKDYFLVHGPPGTGKSRVLTELAVQKVRAGQRLLATAPSNTAVDHLLELFLSRGLRAIRVGHPARVAEALQAHTLDALVEAHPDRIRAKELYDEAWGLQGYARKQRKRGRSAERFERADAAREEAQRLKKEASKLDRNATRQVLAGAQIVCATCTVLGSTDLELGDFDATLFDEATQIIEPLALWAFLRQAPVILAGDPQQLPPTVVSQEAQHLGLGRSLFERLLAQSPPTARKMLREQYRMHETIMAYPSKTMYQNELRAHPSVATHTLSELLSPKVSDFVPPLELAPLLFVDTSGKGFDERDGEGSESKVNEGEANLLCARLARLLEAGLPPEQVALIAPYRAQAQYLRELCRQRLGALAEGVEMDTVDAFQGREKEAILLSLTRSNPEGSIGFLSDLRRMNVAITRARRQLFVVGDGATLAAHPFYKGFMDHVQQCGGERSAWDWPEGETSS